jgi:hypothetical protein
MNVKHSVQLSDLHSIELGEATWDNNAVSIRNRYDLDSGKFSRHNSSEIPINDLPGLVKFACEHQALTESELKIMLKAIVLSLND